MLELKAPKFRVLWFHINLDTNTSALPHVVRIEPVLKCGVRGQEISAELWWEAHKLHKKMC